MIILIAITVVVASIIYSIFHPRYKYFASIGVPGPKTDWIMGNLQQMIGGERIFNEVYREWTKQFGKTYGYYEHKRAMLVTSDVDILNEVFVKQFSNFHGRPLISATRWEHFFQSVDTMPDPDTRENANMFDARGLRWKRLRGLMSGSFSVNSLRGMAVMADRSAKTFAKRTIAENEATNGKGFDIYPFCQDVTLEIIAQVAFGDDRQLQGNPDNPYIEACRTIFKPPQTRGMQIFRYIFLAAGLIPFNYYLFRFLMWLQKQLCATPNNTLIDLVRATVENRRQAIKNNDSSAYRSDFVQLLIDAETTPDSTADNELLGIIKADTNGKVVKLAGAVDVERRLTAEIERQEIVSQLFLFLVAGYDTTSNTLGYTSYLLATNQDKQDKVLAEIDALHLDVDADMTYEQANELPYLDLVMKEALRMYPMVAIAVSRESQRDCVVGGIRLKKKVGVRAELLSLHYDKDLWGADADEFRPERFTPAESVGRHPLAWMPFGGGPRMCIGIRLAQVEFKMAMARLLTKHRLVVCDKTTIPVKVLGPAVMSPKDVTIVMEKR